MPSLLLVVSGFAPNPNIGARRGDRIAAQLRDRGWQVTVLTLPLGFDRVDLSLAVPADIEVLRVPPPAPRPVARLLSTTWARYRPRRAPRHAPPAARPGDATAAVAAGPSGRLRGPAKAALGKWLRRYEMPDDLVGWQWTAAMALRGRRFDVVLGSVPRWSAAVVARVAARRCSARLVLDYRDPWTDLFERAGETTDEATLARHRILETACLERADLVTVVTPTLQRWLTDRWGRAPLLVTNAWDSQPPPPRAAATQRLFYAGSLAYGRSLAPIFAAMRRTPDAKLTLDYLGGHGATAQQQAALHGQEERLRLLGSLRNDEVFAHAADAAAGVVVVSSGFDYAYPGKMFELITQGVPMLLIGPEGCDAVELVRRHRLGWARDPADIAGIATDLREIAAGVRPEPRDLDALSPRHTMDLLDRALRGLL